MDHQECRMSCWTRHRNQRWWLAGTLLVLAVAVEPARASGRPIVEVLCESTLFTNSLTASQQENIERQITKAVRDVCNPHLKYLEWRAGGRAPGPNAAA